MEECHVATQSIKKRLSINKYRGTEENMENTPSMPNALKDPLLPNDQVQIYNVGNNRKCMLADYLYRKVLYHTRL
jgi:hypothetical protein